MWNLQETIIYCFISIWCTFFNHFKKTHFYPAILKVLIGKIHLACSRISLKSNFLKKAHTADLLEGIGRKGGFADSKTLKNSTRVLI